MPNLSFSSLDNSIYMPSINPGNCAKIKDWLRIKVQNMHYNAEGAQLELKCKCYAWVPVGLQI